jgi:hypothetical protein
MGTPDLIMVLILVLVAIAATVATVNLAQGVWLW